MKLIISKRGKTFEVDSPDLSGSPPVGRDTTMMGALGQWLHHNRDLIGVVIDLDPSAEPAEARRRVRELGKR